MPYVGNTALTVVSTVTIVEIAELMTNYRLYDFGREEIFNIRMVATANNFRTLNHFMIEPYFFHYLQNLLTFSRPAYRWGVAGAAARVGASKHLDPLQQRIDALLGCQGETD